MINVGNIKGSAAQAKPLIIGKDIVYVHTDIVQVTNEDGKPVDNLFSYNEVQYDKDEYLKLMIDENQKSANDITDLQLALAEMYELAEGGTN